MSPQIDRFFRAFEGTRSAYPIAVFRIAFFSGLALHFFPSLLWFDEGYRPGALRTEEWNEWLFEHFWRFPEIHVRIWSILAMAGCLAAILGVFPRVSAVVCGVGFYVFASFNALRLQTLALVEAWGVLTLWMICGGGANVLSVQARMRKKAADPAEPRLLSGLVLFQVLLGVFFAGIEKLLAGWPWSNEMGIVLSYPRGFMVRDWVAALAFMHSSLVTHAFTWFTMVVELGTPIGLLFKRSRRVSLILYQLFFLGIIAMLEVPALFYFTFAAGGLLALDDDEVAAILAWMRKTFGRGAPAGVT